MVRNNGVFFLDISLFILICGLYGRKVCICSHNLRNIDFFVSCLGALVHDAWHSSGISPITVLIPDSSHVLSHLFGWPLALGREHILMSLLRPISAFMFCICGSRDGMWDVVHNYLMLLGVRRARTISLWWLSRQVAVATNTTTLNLKLAFAKSALLGLWLLVESCFMLRAMILYLNFPVFVDLYG